MNCPYCGGLLLPESYYDETIQRTVDVIACKLCGRPLASRRLVLPYCEPGDPESNAPKRTRRSVNEIDERTARKRAIARASYHRCKERNANAKT